MNISKRVADRFGRALKRAQEVSNADGHLTCAVRAETEGTSVARTLAEAAETARGSDYY